MCILSELYGRNCNLFAFQTQKFLILMRLFLSVRIGSATKQILCHSESLYLNSGDYLLSAAEAMLSAYCPKLRIYIRQQFYNSVARADS